MSFLISTGTPIHSKQQVNDLLVAIFLPSETAVIKTEGHTINTKHEYHRNALPDSHVKAAAKESAKVMAPVGEVHSAYTKYDLLLPGFCHPDVLVTWRQYVTKSEK